MMFTNLRDVCYPQQGRDAGSSKREGTMNRDMMKLIAMTLGYQLSGRLHSSKGMIGKVFRNADGHECVIFRHTALDPADGQAKRPQAMFRMQFQVPKIVRWRDRLVIALKSPIFVGLPGFRSKLWMVDERSCTYQGVYEWDTLQDAEAYVNSASMAFMAGVAVPGRISYEIIPGGEIGQIGAALSICVPPAPTRGIAQLSMTTG
jgi:hypothetical protein